jgi:hypothetical protein
MSLTNSRWLNSAWIGRAILLVIGLGLVIAGLRVLSVGPTGDENKWRGFLFAPLAVVLDLAFLIALVATWRRPDQPRSVPRGSASRKLRKGVGGG